MTETAEAERVTPERVRELLEAGEPTCLKCGATRSNHHFRHPFQPSHTTTLETAAPDLAAAYLALAAERDALREALLGAAAALAAAISLLERGGKKAAPSDMMFVQMLTDYNAALNEARAALTGEAKR